MKPSKTTTDYTNEYKAKIGLQTPSDSLVPKMSRDTPPNIKKVGNCQIINHKKQENQHNTVKTDINTKQPEPVDDAGNIIIINHDEGTNCTNVLSSKVNGIELNKE